MTWQLITFFTSKIWPFCQQFLNINKRGTFIRYWIANITRDTECYKNILWDASNDLRDTGFENRYRGPHLLKAAHYERPVLVIALEIVKESLHAILLRSLVVLKAQKHNVFILNCLIDWGAHKEKQITFCSAVYHFSAGIDNSATSFFTNSDSGKIIGF